MEINEQDFKRLNLTTKMIKIVTKIQDQQRNNDETEEWIEEEKPLHGSNNDNPRSNKTSGVQIIDPDNPYAGINLEQVCKFLKLLIIHHNEPWFIRFTGYQH